MDATGVEGVAAAADDGGEGRAEVRAAVGLQRRALQRARAAGAALVDQQQVAVVEQRRVDRAVLALAAGGRPARAALGGHDRPERGPLRWPGSTRSRCARSAPAGLAGSSGRRSSPHQTARAGPQRWTVTEPTRRLAAAGLGSASAHGEDGERRHRRMGDSMRPAPRPQASHIVRPMGVAVVPAAASGRRARGWPRAGPGPRALAARFGGSAPLLVVAVSLLMQIGSALAALLFAQAGVLGTLWLRTAFAAAVLLVAFRGRLRFPTAGERVPLLLFAVVLAAMNVLLLRGDRPRPARAGLDGRVPRPAGRGPGRHARPARARVRRPRRRGGACCSGARAATSAAPAWSWRSARRSAGRRTSCSGGGWCCRSTRPRR